MKLSTKIIPLVLILLLAMFVLPKLLTKIIENSAPKENDTEQSIPSKKDAKLEKIRNREDIKFQQELIVYIVFLREEKDRLQKEKDEAINQFDVQILEIEKEIEEALPKTTPF